ncbi:hypothetical protein N473_17885 [Pseudoalteromonas luteoviolacea CPMOR-1]|uniref:Uncharacterized protein n=1 Tax=Pseudoalteromonas luteoviolacea CPMOR-1 TaxID=1365248 RepID=A0A167KUM7_9GAMM|nr:hypothetical protein [Pseudoalteromonas luteoviolacea]KZN63300.1 hypothetical protein N473_17885 [Pseudoalteromonas luteoviolacea CPMOR-1]
MRELTVVEVQDVNGGSESVDSAFIRLGEAIGEWLVDVFLGLFN